MSDEELKQAMAELQEVVRCRCDEAYRDRGLKDPHCECDSAEAVKIVADRIKALTAERDQHWDSFVHWRKEADDRSEQLAAARQDAKEAEAYAEELADKLSVCERHRDAYAEMDRIGAQAVRDLEAKLAKAVEALEPFAKAAETWEPDDGDSGLGARIEHPHHGLERHAEFTFGDLRRARATLAEIKGESHDPL